MPESIFSPKSPCIDFFLKEQEHTFTAKLSRIFKEMSLARQSIGTEIFVQERLPNESSSVSSSAEVGEPDGRMSVLLCTTMGYTQERKSSV